MDVTVFLEPKVDLERLSGALDGLGHEGRLHAVGTWTKKHQRAIFEAAKGYLPIDLDDLVPPAVAELSEVRFPGFNTLPLFSRFEKRFCKTGDPEAPVAGYNPHSQEVFIGPGYFVVDKGTGEHEGELLIDYRKVPKTKPARWPDIQPNRGLIPGIVFGDQVDYLRKLSTHVYIGAAFKGGKDRNSLFACVRMDPAST